MWLCVWLCAGLVVFIVVYGCEWSFVRVCLCVRLFVCGCVTLGLRVPLWVVGVCWFVSGFWCVCVWMWFVMCVRVCVSTVVCVRALLHVPVL